MSGWLLTASDVNVTDMMPFSSSKEALFDAVADSAVNIGSMMMWATSEGLGEGSPVVPPPHLLRR